VGAYRTSGTVPEEPVPECMRPVVINQGILTPREQRCPKPGWWSRVWNGVQSGDRWRCRCGKLYKWITFTGSGEWEETDS